MTDRAELAKRLLTNAAGFKLASKQSKLIEDCGSSLQIKMDWEQAALTCEEAAAALSAGEGGAWSLPKFFREEEPSFGFEADTESMSPEQAAITLMRRLRREVNELRNPQPRKDGEAT